MTETASAVPVLSVSDANRAVRDVVEGSFGPFWLAGEVGSLVLHHSGHAYFTLKDNHTQIKACFFGGAAVFRKLSIDNGSRVEAFGKLTVYEVRGEYQFSARELRLAGQGDLKQQFEELRKRLEAEGLFALERKKPIPRLPRRIGVVTSPSGAAIRDFLQIIERRFPNVNVRIYPCQVQGEEATHQIAEGVRYFNRESACDVLVITRGGGSMEDLWCFNGEELARAVSESRIPVISAVGHEIDYTICDFAADLRVPTPSAAAELVIAHHEELFRQVRQSEVALRQLLMLKMADSRTRLTELSARHGRYEPHNVLRFRQQRLDELEIRMEHTARRILQERKVRLSGLTASLLAQNPEKLLERGYAMILDTAGHPVTTSKIDSGTELELRFADGSTRATVN